jgi:hypothetical protein
VDVAIYIVNTTHFGGKGAYSCKKIKWHFLKLKQNRTVNQMV